MSPGQSAYTSRGFRATRPLATLDGYGTRAGIFIPDNVEGAELRDFLTAVLCTYREADVYW